MNDPVPTNEYKVWYDSLHEGTQIEYNGDKYFIPDSKACLFDNLNFFNSPCLDHMLEQFKLQCNSPV